MGVAAISPRAGFFRPGPVPEKGVFMEKLEKQALQVAKEVVIKFIEVGRISPANFGETFQTIYQDVLRAVSQGGGLPGDGE